MPCCSASLLSHAIFPRFYALALHSFCYTHFIFSTRALTPNGSHSVGCARFQQPDESSSKWKAHNRDLEHLVWCRLWFQCGWIDKKKLILVWAYYFIFLRICLNSHRLMWHEWTSIKELMNNSPTCPEPGSVRGLPLKRAFFFPTVTDYLLIQNHCDFIVHYKVPWGNFCELALYKRN